MTYIKEDDADNKEVEAKDLKNAGNYRVKIIATSSETNGIYGNQITSNYPVTIEAKPLTPAMVTFHLYETAYHYNKRVQQPDIEVKEGDRYITPSNYDIILPESIEAGEYTATVKGKNNYTGIIQENYRIEPNSIVDMTNIKCQYTGAVQQPYPNIYFFDEEITSVTPLDSKKFKYTWKNNIDAGTPASAAKPTVEVTYIGTSDRFNGTVGARFTIEPLALSYYDLDITISNQVSLNTVINEQIKYKGTLLKRYTDYNISANNNTASISLIGNYKNYNDQPITKSFTNGKNEINSENTFVIFNTYSYNYTGSAVTPNPTSATWKDVYGKSTVLIAGKDYDIKYEDNVTAGTGKVIISGKGTYSGTLIKEFTIVGKENIVTTKYTKYVKYLSSKAFLLSSKSTGDGSGFKYTSDTPSVATVSQTGTVSIVGIGTAKIKVETVGTSAFNPAYKYVSITVKPQKLNVTLTAPARGKIKVKIRKIDGVTKYQVKYGYGGKYKSRYLTHLNNGYSTTTMINGLKKGKLYYVKVRAYKTTSDGTKIYGSWTTMTNS